MIDTILVAVGPHEDERAALLARAAIEIAAPTGATVVLGHVFDEEEYDDLLEKLEFDRARSEVTPDDVAERLVAVRDVERLFDEADVDYEIRGEVGDRADTVVALADRIGADRIVVGGRRRSPAGKAVFGSAAQEIMLNAHCPVEFVREGMGI